MTSHQLRHTYATALVNAGVSLQALMALLGHVSAEMSLRYGRLFDATVRTEYERALDLAKQRLGTLPDGRTALPLADITNGANWGTARSSSPGWPAGSACALPRRAPAPTPTSASTARASALTPATCPSWQPSEPTPSSSPATPKNAAGSAKPTGTASSSPASTTSSAGHRPDDQPRPHRPGRAGMRRTRRRRPARHLHRCRRPCRIGRATLYRDPALRALVDGQRHDAASAGTLTGLAGDIAALRTAIKAVAARVRHHEEQIRQLNRKSSDPARRTRQR